MIICFVAVLSTADAFSGERFATPNFIVDAPTRELARKFGEYAEHYRREKALDWLGQEMPTWREPCPLKVQIRVGQGGGETTFSFDRDGRYGVLSQEMRIFGSVDHLLRSVLPHEVTHTVFAYRFGQPVPRWADEGGSVLSENDEERYNHDIKCRELLNQGHGIRLKKLFSMSDYPAYMIVCYAQGYSISQYLIDQGGKQKFLQFVESGMRNKNRGWEEAALMYGYNSIDEMEEAWLRSLKTPPKTLAARAQLNKPSVGAAVASRTASREVRTSVMGLPQLEPPILARGAAPEERRSTEKAASPTEPPLPRLGPPEIPNRK